MEPDFTFRESFEPSPYMERRKQAPTTPQMSGASSVYYVRISNIVSASRGAIKQIALSFLLLHQKALSEGKIYLDYNAKHVKVDKRDYSVSITIEPVTFQQADEDVTSMRDLIGTIVQIFHDLFPKCPEPVRATLDYFDDAKEKALQILPKHLEVSNAYKMGPVLAKFIQICQDNI